MTPLSLFPTDVYVETINIIPLDDIILKMSVTEPSRKVTNMGGWQSNDALHEHKAFSKLVDAVSICFLSIGEKYRYEKKCGITNMWANVNRYRDYNKAHIHTGTQWSFVYYVKVPDDSGNLVFVDPRIRRISSAHEGINESYDNPFTHDLYVLTPLPGTLVFFPSYLEHYVEGNSNDIPRISISGNIKVGV